MAIIFTKSISQSKLLYAFNNNVVLFKTNTTNTPLTAEIIGLGVDVKLYPNPKGEFYFNFKEYITTIINTDNFTDDMNVVSGIWYYDWTSKIVLNQDITFKINFSNKTNETLKLNLNWLSAYVQIDEFRTTYLGSNLTDEFVLTPQKTEVPKLKYWKGYPFDVTIFTNDNADLQVDNSTTKGKLSISKPHPKIIRLIMSNGLNETPLNIATGSNEFKFNDKAFIIDAITPNCDEKHYLKWINRYGGWNYWLFNKGKKTITPKGIGELNNDFNNIYETMSQTISLGVNSKGSISLTDNVSDDEMMLLSDLFESPKVYLFTGKPNTVNNYNNWIEINVKDKAVKVQDSKFNYLNIQLEVELPTRITRTI